MVAEKTMFVKTFGDVPLVRVLDFLLCEGLYFEYSLTELAKTADISWSTLHEILPKLRELELIKETRRVGRAKLFATNRASPIIQKFIALDLAISEFYGKPQAIKLRTLRQKKRG